MIRPSSPIRLCHPLCLGVAAVALCSLFTGCRSIGPGTVNRDRFDYSTAIADSWKQQTLLNIVKLRYFDLPVFVDVSSVVAGYSLQTGLTGSGTLSTESAVQGNFLSGTGQAIYTDRPTITYTPLTGQKFLRSLLTPIDPKNIFFMLQSGYAADFVLALTVDSLNGLHNRSASNGAIREADPDFIRVLQLMREVQVAGGVGVRVQENQDKSETTVMFFRRDNLPPETLDKIAEIRRLLKLSPDRQQFKLVYSPAVGADDELTVGSRSMLLIMAAMSSYADVPAVDVKSGRALPSPFPAGDQEVSNGADAQSPVRIKCSSQKPASAFAAVHYRDQWFYVDDTDWRTKRAFTSIMFLFTMMDNPGDEKLPLITIPAQ